jgi:hypothetical protein
MWWKRWTIIIELSAKRIESTKRQLNVVLSELQSWKRDTLMTRINFWSNLAMRCTLIMNHKTKFESFASRVNDTVKIAFKRQTKLKKKIKNESMHELLWIMISNRLCIFTTLLTITMTRWVKRSIWSQYWSSSSNRHLIEMMISSWKRMMSRVMTLAKATSSDREKKRTTWNVTSIVFLRLILISLKIADCSRRIIFEIFLTETRSSSWNWYMKIETRFRRISSIKKWSRCSKDCRQLLTKTRQWRNIDVID